MQRALAVEGACTIGPGWGGQTTCKLGTLTAGSTAHVILTAQVTTTVSARLPWTMRNVAWVTATEASNSALVDTVLHDCHARLNNDPGVYSDLQAALDASAQEYDMVKVAGYCAGLSLRGGQRQVAYLDKNLILLGGWNVGFTRRDVRQFPTTLDARGQGRVIYITGDITAIIDGLRIVGGKAPEIERIASV